MVVAARDLALIEDRIFSLPPKTRILYCPPPCPFLSMTFGLLAVLDIRKKAKRVLLETELSSLCLSRVHLNVARAGGLHQAFSWTAGLGIAR